MLLVPEVIGENATRMKRALEDGRAGEAAEIAGSVSSGRAAQILAEASPQIVGPTLDAMDLSRAGAILGAMAPSLAAEILHGMDEGKAGKYVAAIRPDHAADIFHLWQRREPEWAASMLVQLEEPARTRVRQLSEFSPGTAGSLMVLSYMAVPRTAIVGDAIDAVRSAPASVERSAYVYVVDPDGRLEGVLSVRELLAAEPFYRVDEVMTSDVAAVRGTDSAVESARLLRNRKLKLLPVVSDDDVLVGVITRDDAFELLTERLAERFVELHQASPDESFFTPPMGAVRRRLPWMGANVFLNLGAVLVISSFESTIAQVAILAAFLPMITDMGGNVGIQALSVAIRSIALGEVQIRDFWRAVRKEVAIGLVNGAALGTLFGVVAFVLQANPWLGLVAGTALAANVFVAGVVGGGLPFIIRRFGKDPAMMTGPFLTTITDITGVSIYLALSTLFLTQIL